MHVSFALFADAANLSQEGKLNILGVFDAVHVGQFPALHPRATFVVRLKAELTDVGTHQMTLRWTNPRGAELWSSTAELAINAAPGLLATPGFLVVLEDRGAAMGGSGARVPAEKQRLLWMLTPSEREIALLICEGCSNAEISTRLKKSLLTTKKQATSIFSKLGVKSRARLMTMLR